MKAPFYGAIVHPAGMELLYIILQYLELLCLNWSIADPFSES